MLADEPTLYDLLEIGPDASPQDIRSAYLRAKAAYKKDSVALYSLMSSEETEALLRRIEEAYQVLSSAERRRDYDLRHGLVIATPDVTVTEPFDESGSSETDPRVVSIDRVPPMDRGSSDADILVPPATDIAATSSRNIAAPAHAPATHTSDDSAERRTQGPRRASDVPAALIEEIAQETEWSGKFIRKVRETKRISLEEIAEYSRISRSYLIAIEEEQLKKLPAPVFVRGFVTQVAKYLKLPAEKVVPAYMARIQAATPQE